MRSFWPSGGLWRHGDFLKLWSAETISQFGSQVGQLAMPLVAILVLDASAFEVAALGTVRVPPVHHLHAAGRRVGRPPAPTTDPDRGRLRSCGAPRDHPDRVRRGCTDARRSSSSSGSSSASLQVFFDVAYQSYLPSLVEREQIIEGNSKLEISRSAAQVAGPGFGGRSSRSSPRRRPSSPTQ